MRTRFPYRSNLYVGIVAARCANCRQEISSVLFALTIGMHCTNAAMQNKDRYASGCKTRIFAQEFLLPAGKKHRFMLSRAKIAELALRVVADQIVRFFPEESNREL